MATGIDLPSLFEPENDCYRARDCLDENDAAARHEEHVMLWSTVARRRRTIFSALYVETIDANMEDINPLFCFHYERMLFLATC
jgi:hypothetical protein